MSDIVTTALGRVQPNYLGAYSSATTYNKLDYVDYEGSSYICRLNGVSNKVPTNSGYWQLVAHKGDMGSVHSVFATAEELSTGATPVATVQKEGDVSNPDFRFYFGIPAGPIGPTGVQAATVSATKRKQDDSGDLGAGDNPWATVSLNSSTHTLGLVLGIPPGHDGQGAVSSVDGYEPTNGNVDLKAVRYDTETAQSLTAAQKAAARANIDAFKAPTGTPEYGQALIYGGTPSNPDWTPTAILQVPVGGTTGYILRKQTSAYGWTPVGEVPASGSAGAVLVKNSNTDYDWSWSPAIDSSAIDSIVNA